MRRVLHVLTEDPVLLADLQQHLPEGYRWIRYGTTFDDQWDAWVVHTISGDRVLTAYGPDVADPKICPDVILLPLDREAEPPRVMFIDDPQLKTSWFGVQVLGTPVNMPELLELCERPWVEQGRNEAAHRRQL